MKDRANNNHIGLFLGLLALSAALRIYRINQGLWYDELFACLVFLPMSFKQIISSAPYPNNHILYTMLAKISEYFFGPHEWAFRLPSLLLGGMTAPLFFLFARKKCGDFIAFVSGVFLAVNYWQVSFGQDARGYAGLILFSMLSQIFYLDWLEGRERKKLPWYFLFSVLGCYFHLYFTFVLAGQFLFGFWKRFSTGGKATVWSFLVPLIALAASLSLYLPVSSQLFEYVDIRGHRLDNQWLDAAFVKNCAALFSGSHLFWPGVLLSLVSCAGAYRVLKNWPGIFWTYLISMTLVIAFTWGFHVFIFARFVSFAMPLYCLCLGAGIEVTAGTASRAVPFLRKKILLAVLSLAILLVMSLSLARYHRLGKQGFKDAAAYIEKNHSGKTVLSYGNSAIEFTYYYGEAIPVRLDGILKPMDVTGNLVVAAFPASWTRHNMSVLDEHCLPEKIWPSALGEGLEVYLFSCH